MSCNGCRVLRKGCSESCILRPCLQWITTADAQGHATVFLAKFYGRSGLMGFIGGVSSVERQALFKSLLFEAVGRTINPVYGAVGLLQTSNWQACQAGVDTVLRGAANSLRPITFAPVEAGMAAYSAPCSLPGLEKSSPSQSSSFPCLPERSEELQKVRGTGFHAQCKGKCDTGNAVVGVMGSYPTQPKGKCVSSSNVVADGDSKVQAVKKEILSWSNVQDAALGFGYVEGRNHDMPKLQYRNGDEKDQIQQSSVVLAPVARRVRPRLDGMSFVMDASVSENVAGVNLELDLTLSSAKRKRTPNSSESVNSEGSVTSLDSAVDPSRCKWKTISAPAYSHNREVLTLF